jgi:hypothetical protein
LIRGVDRRCGQDHVEGEIRFLQERHEKE